MVKIMDFQHFGSGHNILAVDPGDVVWTPMCIILHRLRPGLVANRNEIPDGRWIPDIQPIK